LTGDTTVDVHGTSAGEIGRIAADKGITLSGLTESGTSLETAFLRLTSDGHTPLQTGTPASLGALKGAGTARLRNRVRHPGCAHHRPARRHVASTPPGDLDLSMRPVVYMVRPRRSIKATVGQRSPGGM
jgi:hypothetical protein